MVSYFAEANECAFNTLIIRKKQGPELSATFTTVETRIFYEDNLLK